MNDAGGGSTIVDSNAGESLTFTNPTASFTLNSGAGFDDIIVSGFGAGFDADLTIDGGATEQDFIRFDADITLAADNNVTLNAEQILMIGATIETTGSGSIDITAGTGGLGTGIDLRDTDLTASGTGTITLVGNAGGVGGVGRAIGCGPEGTRSSNGTISDFKPTLGHLALTYAVDILPVYIGGTHQAMPKGRSIPTSRDIYARIGPPITVADMQRLTQGLSSADASREIAKLAHRAVVALQEGKVLDASKLESLAADDEPKSHPLVTLFQELEGKFDKGLVDKPVSFYFTLGNDEMSKWTVRVDPASGCEVKLGKPSGGTADCVLKTSPEIFTRIVRDAYTPSPAEFMSGAIKSNDVSLLMTFQKVFQLGG